mgnify:CR=1 FL=1
MTKNFYFKWLSMTCFFIFYIVTCVEAGSHPKKIKDETQSNGKVKETVISPAFVPMQPNSADQFQLDNALANLQGKLTSQIPLIDHMENIDLNVSDSVACGLTYRTAKRRRFSNGAKASRHLDMGRTTRGVYPWA